MGRRIARRLATAISCAAVVACVVNLNFDMDQQTLALSAPGQGSIAQSVQIDLGKYPEVASHRNDIRSLDLDSVDVTITDVKADNLAKSLTLTLAVRKDLSDPPSGDLAVGTLNEFPVMKQATRRLAGNPALDAFLLDRLANGGTFWLVVTGTTDDVTDIVLDANLHASIAYDSGFF